MTDTVDVHALGTWPAPGTQCVIEPCAHLADMPGPMCFAHFRIIARPYQRAITDAAKLRDNDAFDAAIAAAVGRVQRTVDMIRTAGERVETPRR